MQTTLNTIREKSPCNEGWAKLLRTLNKTKADDEPVSIVQILDSNGLDDALWCLRCVVGQDKEIRLFAVWCARQVQHLMTYERSLIALDVVEKFANNQATEEQLAVAWSAARDAWAAARDDAAVAWSTAYAARSAAGAAAEAAEAAGAAARSAAGAAAEAARSAAGAAAEATAWAAAGSAEAAQEKELRRVCSSCV